VRATLSAPSNVFRRFPTHRHECWEILLCLSGTGVAVIGEESYPFTDGTIFCIPPGIPHSKEAENGFSDGSVWLMDFLPPDNRSILIYQDDAEHTFQHLYDTALRIQLQKPANHTAIVNSIADVMYQLLVGWSSTLSPSCPPVERFQSLLLDNVRNCNFDLSLAIAQTGYSSSYFRKLFKEVTGLSPIMYFNRMRIEYAKTLLQQDSTLSIKEIAASAGFPDPYYFSRVFKKITGFSPSDYLLSPMDHSLIKGMPEDGTPFQR